MKRSLPILFILLGLAGISGRALEIPLEQKAGGGGTTVGFVDMEAIFQEFPETQKAKAEYYKELAKRRELLDEREKELADLREQLVILRTNLKDLEESLQKQRDADVAESTAAAAGEPGTEATAEVEGSTEAVPSPPVPTPPSMGVSPESIDAVRESLLQRQKVLEEKEAALQQTRLDAARSLQQLEERRALQIFGKLYRSLVQLAEENGITLVVDKSSILYGQDAMDLTERLRRRVRGLPDVDIMDNP